MANNIIDLPTAIQLTQNYRSNKDAMVAPDYAQSFHLAETFDASAIRAILDQPGCVEFRAYFGMKENKSICLIFVGVNEQNDDMVGTENNPGVLVEFGRECPPSCSNPSPLLG